MFALVLAERTLSDLRERVRAYLEKTSLFEIRLDYLERIEEKALKEFLTEFQNKASFILTLRAASEGGKCEKEAYERWQILEELAPFGATLIDLEYQLCFKGNLKRIIKKSTLFPEKILFSYHNFEGTPSLKELQTLLKKAKGEGIRWFKIATLTSSFDEAFQLLTLIPFGKTLGLKVIAFGMGREGRLSRVLNLLLGSPFTYCFPDEAEAIAPGQLSLSEAKRLYEFLKDV